MKSTASTRSRQRNAGSVRYALLGALPLLLAGCDLNFTDPFGFEAAFLSARLDVVDGDPGEVRFMAQLRPGRDRNSDLRRVTHDVLEVLGVTLTPVRIRSDSVRTYQGTWTLEGGSPAVIPRLQVPSVDPVVSLPGPLSFGTCSRTDGEDRSITPADTVVFRVGCDRAPRAPVHTQWELRIRGARSGAPLLHLRSVGEIPEEVGILAAWLDGESGEEMVATVTVTDLLGWSAPGEDYRITLDIHWEFDWLLEWCQEPSEACAASESTPRSSPSTTRSTKQ
jgi:hypothetical protein